MPDKEKTMIKHIVCFKLKDCTPQKAETARDLLLSMKGRVPEVTVDDRAALERYQNDPYHCGTVKKHMHAVRESSVAVDVELPEETPEK